MYYIQFLKFERQKYKNTLFSIRIYLALNKYIYDNRYIKILEQIFRMNRYYFPHKMRFFFQFNDFKYYRIS